MQIVEPTAQTYAELRLAYQVFNDRLFDGCLPSCLITLQREKKTYGYFSSKRFGTRDGRYTDEIALNPEYFAAVPMLETLQTVAHEMTHLWQAHFGTPGRGRYHNAEWADKMEAIGLMPSSTGRPGGRRVGDHMADYVIAGGPFSKAVDHLVSERGFTISWYDRHVATAPLYQTTSAEEASGIPSKALTVAANDGVTVVRQLAGSDTVNPAAHANRSNRTKFTCPGCGANAWGKPGLLLACVPCELQLAAESVLAPIRDPAFAT